MAKPLVTIELDEYNKLIEQSKSISNLLDDLGISIIKSEEPSILNNYNFFYDVIIEKRKLEDFIRKQYTNLNFIKVKFKEVKE